MGVGLRLARHERCRSCSASSASRTRSRSSRAHRTPDKLYLYGAALRDRGLKAIIAGAGSGAPAGHAGIGHRAPRVIGVPVQLATPDGLDSLLSIVQMPAIPVATVSINGAKNAGLLAARISVLSDACSGEWVEQYAKLLEEQAEEKNRRLKEPA